MSALAAITALWLAVAAAADTPPAAPAAPQAAADPEASEQPAPGVAPQASFLSETGPDQQAAITAAYQAAEAMQGPLDGIWRVDDADGDTLLIVDLSDPGAAPAPLAASPDHPGVEGAWRDPSHPRDPNASGFLDSVARQSGSLQIRFVAGADRRAEHLTLRAAAGGRWTGELDGAGAPRAVVMRRF